MIMKQLKISHKEREELCIRLLGWKWVSFIGIPHNEHPTYPAECRVRQLLSAKQLKNKYWREMLDANDAQPATGEEPLSYRYCSSQGPARVPEFVVLVEDQAEDIEEQAEDSPSSTDEKS
jgi:hypothetical protein